MGWEVKNDIRGQAKQGLRILHMEIRKYLPAQPGQISQNF